MVRVLDFERAFAHLAHEEQLALAAIYRDGQDHEVASKTIGCSQRKLCYLMPAARQHLADVLNRLDLL